MVKLPRLTLLLVAGVAVVGGLGLTEPALLQATLYSRTALQEGQLWRLLLGHLAHFSVSHLIWNGLAFALLAALLEQREGSLKLLRTLLLLVVGTGCGLYLLVPGMEFYGGLSAVNYGLLTVLLVRTGSDHPVTGQRRPAPPVLAAVAGLPGLCLYQALSGASLAPGSTSLDGVTIAWQAHLLAILMGCLTAALPLGRAFARSDQHRRRLLAGLNTPPLHLTGTE